MVPGKKGFGRALASGESIKKKVLRGARARVDGRRVCMNVCV